MLRYVLYCYVVLFAAFLCSCDAQKYPDLGDDNKPQLLIYSGMTMLKPLVEIADLVEEQCDCEVKITFGSSGHMYTSVQVNKIGDIFFPGSVSFIDQLQQAGVVKETARVGYNQAALFVAKGNPQNISADLTSLFDASINVVIGNPATGAIGRETKTILEPLGIYQKVSSQAEYLTTGYKGLVQAINTGDADLVINWRTAGFNPSQTNTHEMLLLPETIAEKRPLVMGLLRYSRHPDLARSFIQTAQSAQGQEIFRKYGFLD